MELIDLCHTDALLEDAMRHVIVEREDAIHTRDSRFLSAVRRFNEQLYESYACGPEYHPLWHGYAEVVVMIQKGARVQGGSSLIGG